MKDNISKGQGISRYLKVPADAKTRWPTWNDALTAMIKGEFLVDFNGKNPAGWQQMGTELSTANLMSGQTASLFNLTDDNVPDDIFDIIGKGLPIKNGGTGATDASKAIYNLVSSLSTVSSASSSYYIPMQYSSSGRRISYSNLANSVKNTVADTLTPQDIGAATVEIGSYVGDGTKGTYDNPVSITFSTAPKVVFIRDAVWYTFEYSNYATTYETFPPVILMNFLSSSEFRPTAADIKVENSEHDVYPIVCFKKSSDGKTIYYCGVKYSDYVDVAVQAFNRKGVTYYYAGIL